VEGELVLTLKELRTAFTVRKIVATLQCAGNRRSGLIAVRDVPGEAAWGPGAIGTASWTGVALSDVLARAGVRADARHVAFVGTDVCEEAAPAQLYGASIPLAKALAGEVLLAWEMNGAPLTPVHGGPLRVVVAGYIGARSVKWLSHIEVRADPWDGYYQETAYRLLAPEEKMGPGVGIALGEVPLSSDILSPGDGDHVPAGAIEARGYAFAGGQRQLARVDVAVDRGRWRQAQLLEDLGPWAWRQWRIGLDLTPGEHELVVRAWDSAAATQPEHPASVWNPKGYVNNSWGAVTVFAH
jgi:sulfite oxidase